MTGNRSLEPTSCVPRSVPLWVSMGSKIPARIQAGVRERSHGVCEGCGQAPATEMHHRKYRSRGGQHTLENLIHLCGWGNHTGCHGIAHSLQGHTLGWSVNSWADETTVPVRRLGEEVPDG
ncbi:HNH endonuclease [Leucobacter sp. M11]|uniref:HNH endonuclease n=1 Tax=Leucobacter sp. M11 TaxID=2993565 RepID=UPI003FA56DE4